MYDGDLSIQSRLRGVHKGESPTRFKSVAVRKHLDPRTHDVRRPYRIDRTASLKDIKTRNGPRCQAMISPMHPMSSAHQHVEEKRLVLA
jgi:hypothetical protein